MEYYSFECLNHSSVAFGMSHANSIDFKSSSLTKLKSVFLDSPLFSSFSNNFLLLLLSRLISASDFENGSRNNTKHVYRKSGVWNNRRGRRGLETFTKKINNRGKRMTQKLFWYQYNKGRVKYCQILKAHKFSIMIYNCHAEFFSFLCVFLMNFVQI